MITAGELTAVGKINKTHGVNGELSASFFDENFKDLIKPGECLIMDIDGIFTPFFVSTVRPRSAESLLITLDTIDSQETAAPYIGKTLNMLTSSLPEAEDGEEEDGLYAGQLIGYKAFADDGTLIGEIIDIDDSTENVLFILRSSKGENIYIPVVDEFIAELSTDDKTITFDLPEGLI